MEPFKGSGVPVLVLQNNVDEIVFQQLQEYKGKRFVNVENSFEEIAKDVSPKNDANQGKPKIGEDDLTPFSLWLKNELSEYVNKVTISKRLTDTPAVLYG